MSDILKKYIFIALGVLLLFSIVMQGMLGYFQKHPVNAHVSKCVLNLNAIADAKSRWMIDNYKASNDIPTWKDLAPYAKDYGWTDGKPTCPQGGIYYIGRMNELPKCSIGGPAHSTMRKQQ